MELICGRQRHSESWEVGRGRRAADQATPDAVNPRDESLKAETRNKRLAVKSGQNAGWTQVSIEPQLVPGHCRPKADEGNNRHL